MQERIIIKVNERGEIIAESKGIMGPSCLEEVNELLKELALVTHVNKTDEYYGRPKVKDLQRAKEEARL